MSSEDAVGFLLYIAFNVSMIGIAFYAYRKAKKRQEEWDSECPKVL